MSAHLQTCHGIVGGGTASLLRRGPEALIQDQDYYAQCSGAVADLEGESA